MFRNIIFLLLVMVGVHCSAETLLAKCQIRNMKTFDDTFVECYVIFDTSKNIIKVTYPHTSSYSITAIESLKSGYLSLSAYNEDKESFKVKFINFTDFVGYPLMLMTITETRETNAEYSYSYRFHPDLLIPICNKLLKNINI